MPIIYGQVVVGPPGSGKTTYCNGMQQYLRLLGRDAWVINLDPANEAIPDSRKPNQEEGENTDVDSTTDTTTNNQLPYETILDICEDVINLSSVMNKLGLGPNGGLLYCMEYLEAHIEDIINLIQERISTYQQSREPTQQLYLLLDLPGQVELYTHGTAVAKLLQHLVKVLDWRLCAVQCIDSLFCTDAHKFLSAALLSTTTMLRLELPMVNVLSKADLLANYGSDLAMDLEYFTHCQDLQRLVPYLDAPKVDDDDDNNHNGVYDEFHFADDPDYQAARRKRRNSPFAKKYQRLHELLAEVVEDFGLLSFIPLDINRAESVGRVLAKIDQANGFVFWGSSSSSSSGAAVQQPQQNYDMLQCAIQSDSVYESLAEIRERPNSNSLQSPGEDNVSKHSE